jgi:hypothetical protein
MKTLYDAAAAEEVKERLRTLTAATPRVWGKMDASQMMAHCAAGAEMGLGEFTPKRLMIGRVIGPLFKGQFTSDKPWGEGVPTAPELVRTGTQDFEAERARLLVLIDRFSQGGAEACTKEPHCFFGKLTAEEWGKGMYKHLDHHLRQFGV